MVTGIPRLHLPRRRVVPLLTSGYPRVVEEFLGIYMNDQLALGMGWREVARRAQRSNHGTELGDTLVRVSAGIAEDVETFRRIMRRLGVRVNPVKGGLAVVAERVGRLKLNGRLRTYSPLSRFVRSEAFNDHTVIPERWCGLLGRGPAHCHGQQP